MEDSAVAHDVSAPFRYTIPIMRAISDDGELFLEGEASGPEVDTFGTRVAPDVVTGFARQIIERAQAGDPIPYRDTHGQGVTGDQPVMADFGELVAATVTDDQHLRVRVRLDRENPAAKFLHTQILRGKRYGMSIGGTIKSYTDEYAKDSGRFVRTFTNVVLDHIANTSQPSWTPSLGTVLLRAVEKALEGENMEEHVHAPETPATEGVEETVTPVEEAVVEAVAQEEVAEVVAEEPTAEVAEATEQPAEEQPTIQVSALQPVLDAVAALGAAIQGLTAPAPEPEPVVARSAESESPAPETDPSTLLRSEMEALRAELQTAMDRIAQLESEPAGDKPQVIQRSDEEVMRDELKSLTPHQRLLIGLEAAAKAAKG